MNKKISHVIIGVFLILSITLCSKPIKPIIINTSVDELKQNINEYQSKKVVLVNIWASWCIPCIEELPALAKLQKNNESDLQVILINLDEDEQINNALDMLKTSTIDWNTYRITDEESLFNWFSNSWRGGLPFTIIYTKKGEISTFWEGGESLDFFEKTVYSAINQ